MNSSIHLAPSAQSIRSSMGPTTCLPDEIVLNIFSQLSAKQWMAAKEVNRQWHRIAHDEWVRPKSKGLDKAFSESMAAYKQVAVNAIIANEKLPERGIIKILGRKKGARSYHDEFMYFGSQIDGTEETFRAQKSSMVHAKTRSQILFPCGIAAPVIHYGIQTILGQVQNADNVKLIATVATTAAISLTAYAVTHVRANAHIAQEVEQTREPSKKIKSLFAAGDPRFTPETELSWKQFENLAYANIPKNQSDDARYRFHVSNAMSFYYEEILTLLSAYGEGWRETYRSG